MRRCVFCQQEGKASKEHLWPKWAGRLFKAPDSSRHVRTFVERDGEEENEEWQARIFTQTVSAVCGACNNGWMAELETGAAPILRPMIIGNRQDVDPLAQHQLSLWAIKTAMMAQFIHPDRRSIDEDDYRWLYQRRMPPPNYRVWLGSRGRDVGKWPAFSAHVGMSIVREDEPWPQELNAHKTTIGIGHLIVHVAGHRIEAEDRPTMDLTDDEHKRCLIPIWPATASHSWPRRYALSERLLDELTPQRNEEPLPVIS